MDAHVQQEPNTAAAAETAARGEMNNGWGLPSPAFDPIVDEWLLMHDAWT
jgi:hypothetical protein